MLFDADMRDLNQNPTLRRAFAWQHGASPNSDANAGRNALPLPSALVADDEGTTPSHPHPRCVILITLEFPAGCVTDEAVNSRRDLPARPAIACLSASSTLSGPFAAHDVPHSRSEFWRPEFHGTALAAALACGHYRPATAALVQTWAAV